MTLVGYTRESLRPPVAQSASTRAGLKVFKYRGGWQTLDQMARREPIAVGESHAFNVAERLRDGHAALAFEGLLRVPADGVFELSLASDDGARLYLGDSLVVDNDGLHGMVEKAGHIGLRAGMHPLRVEWFNAGGGMGLSVKWAGKSMYRCDTPR